MVQQPQFAIALGAKVKDKLTPFTGVVVGRTEWLYGCHRYVVQSAELKDGIPTHPVQFDTDSLIVIEDSEAELLPIAEPVEPKKMTGGPGDPVSRHSVSVSR